MIEEDDEVDIIFDKDLILKLNEKNCEWFEYASDELKDDKEVVLKAVEHNGWLIGYGSERLRKDELIVLTAVKSKPNVVIELYDKNICKSFNL